jgi:hypothetical protein
MTRPDNQALLEEISQMPAAQDATWDLGNSIGHGIVDRIFVDAGLAPAPQTISPLPNILSRALWLAIGLLTIAGIILFGLLICMAIAILSLWRSQHATTPHPSARK